MKVVAKVNQLITRTVVLEVDTTDHAEAIEKAKDFLHDYPNESTIPEVSRAVTAKTEYWTPRDIEFLEVRDA